MASDMASAEIVVRGRVQGVGYRYFTEKVAARLGVTGWSMNMPDGSVMVEVEAERSVAESFIDELRRGPSMSVVTDVSVTWKPYEGRYTGFSIRF